MNEQKNYNGRGIFYGVIGVATLVVAIIGATFAYFTASASNENAIQGNMATIKIGLQVSQVTSADDNPGLIPMSNSMVEVAVNTSKSKNNICVDDAGNAVCQVYKVVVTNSSAAAVFVDGFVALQGGSGAPTDYTYAKNPATTMRWAQVFCTESDGAITTCTTESSNVGTSLGASTSLSFASIDNSGVVIDDPETKDVNEAEQKAKNIVNIRSAYNSFGDGFDTAAGVTISKNESLGVLASATINGNVYAVIGKNYIRTSDHAWKAADSLDPAEVYTQTADVTSALVYNQSLAATNGAQTYYFVVWLSETGTNQNPDVTSAPASNFFKGQVKFLSAQGSEVSATFGGYTRVPATDNGAQTQTPASGA